MTQRRIYQNEFPYFVTFNTIEGFELFDDTKLAELMARVIIKTCAMKKFDVLSFQIMPEHIHALVFNQHRAHPAVGALRSKMATPIATTAGCARVDVFTISHLMHGIKSYYCDVIRKQYNINYPIFQKRFYTRIINTQKYLEKIIEYIKQNPIKAELPEKYHKAPYQFIDWEKIKTLF